MKLVFSAPDALLVHSVRGFLESRGIATCLVGEERPSTAGRVPPNECWVELHVYDDQLEAQAVQLVQEYLHAPENGAMPWTCPVCGESNSAKSTDCWKCAVPPPVQHENHLLSLALGALSLLLFAYSLPTVAAYALRQTNPSSRLVAPLAAFCAAAYLLFRAVRLLRRKP